jgi:CBS domain-containing protein
VAALGVTVLFMRRSILTEKLARRGRHIAREYAVDPFDLLRVSEAMEANPPVLPANTPLRSLATRLAANDPEVSQRQALLLTHEDGTLAGILTRGDVIRALEQKPAPVTNETVLEVAGARGEAVAVCYPEEILHDAVARLLRHGVGRLPVVASKGTRTIVGYLGRTDILAARERFHREEEVRETGFDAARARVNGNA